MIESARGAAARSAIRSGTWTGPTASLAPGAVQANLVILPAGWAEEFSQFCERTPRALPLLERTPIGSPVPARTAPSADLRTDLPRYQVYRRGRLSGEVDDLRTLWRDDLVCFLLGCSFTFDAILSRAGIEVRHIVRGCNVPMYVTARKTLPVGRLHGPLVVSMRPIRAAEIDRVIALTDGLTEVHGAPVHVGEPGALGIANIESPEYGERVPVHRGEIPAFWACGVTAHAVAEASRVPFMITHAPGHMFITDRSIDEVRADVTERRGSELRTDEGLKDT